VRRPDQLRVRSLIGALAAVAFGLLVAWLVHLALGRQGLLGFGVANAAGLLEGGVFVVTSFGALRAVRALLRLPSSSLLSFGLAVPPSAASAAAAVPTVDADALVQTMAEHRQVVVLDDGVPVGIAGVHPDRVVAWDEVVKVDAAAALTELRPVLARAPLVAVMDGDRVVGIVTQERYLAVSWGRGA
jgi:CBS domain-containing protein